MRGWSQMCEWQEAEGEAFVVVCDLTCHPHLINYPYAQYHCLTHISQGIGTLPGFLDMWKTVQYCLQLQNSIINTTEMQPYYDAKTQRSYH